MTPGSQRQNLPSKGNLEQAQLVKIANHEKQQKTTAANAVAKYNTKPSSFNDAEKQQIYEIADKFGYSTYTGRQKEQVAMDMTNAQKWLAGSAGFIDEALLFGLVPDKFIAEKLGGGNSEEARKLIRNAGYGGAAASLFIPGLGAAGLLAKGAKGAKAATTSARLIKGVKAATKTVKALDTASDGIRILDKAYDIAKAGDKAADIAKATRKALKATDSSKAIAKAAKALKASKSGKLGAKATKTLATNKETLKTTQKALEEALSALNKVSSKRANLKALMKTTGGPAKMAKAEQTRNFIGTLLGPHSTLFQSSKQIAKMPGVGIPQMLSKMKPGIFQNSLQGMAKLGPLAFRGLNMNENRNDYKVKTAWEQYQEHKTAMLLGGMQVPTGK